MGFLDKLLRRADPAQAWASRCTAVVFYALPEAETLPGPQTPCLVLDRFFVPDARVAFGVELAPQRAVVSGAEFEVVLEQAALAPRRDVNSRGRVEYVRRWFLQESPAWVTCQLEPPEIAGTGSAGTGESPA